MPGIYVHIPFCVSKCRYCDFPSYSGKEEWIAAYVHSLSDEAHALSCERDWGVFDTVFFGGGTPSLLSAGMLCSVLECLRSEYCISLNAEITVECNPGTLTKDKLAAYLDSGVNRLSIGVQSLDNNLLTGIGRIHGAAQAVEAFCMARDAGFTNINADIMHGLPGQTEADYLSTLSGIMELAPTHISAYQLILEEHTPLYEDVTSGAVLLPPSDEINLMQDMGISLLNTCGYKRYEISNFAKPGFECRHNINYWKNGMYLGLGAGAHSAWRIAGEDGLHWTRWENTKDIDSYMANSEKHLNKRDLTLISSEEEAFECVMLGLRMVSGFSLSSFHKRFGQRFEDMYKNAVYILKNKGWLIVDNDRARLTKQGLDMQNTVLMEFMD